MSLEYEREDIRNSQWWFNIAYISGCTGTIQSGPVTCASGDKFTIVDTGRPIYTVVAECYND